ncbi:hypothetical protein GCM10010277_51040 [Streptomyces longisporoflavus]|uniref:DUF397 domain-containing protein n=1 Tax=Streptomyces longisporoflavus TaxID=28044 RepID=UPI00167EF3F6|nr:DUF397 domain-containing protein [Streptomyces longisporoflavus]GGV53451.1 hypothetical protein GCM10010277_51040 [Streptomyces longisporoflavus]
MNDIPPNLDWIRAAPEGEDGPGPWIEIAYGPEDAVYLRETSDPENVVTTTQKKWDAFVLGVQAGEFDHFVEGVEGAEVVEGEEASKASRASRPQKG